MENKLMTFVIILPTMLYFFGFGFSWCLYRFNEKEENSTAQMFFYGVLSFLILFILGVIFE